MSHMMDWKIRVEEEDQLGVNDEREEFFLSISPLVSLDMAVG